MYDKSENIFFICIDTLGIRTLIKSIKLTDNENDVIVLATDSVSQATRELFSNEGAKIVPIPPIPNPYKYDFNLTHYYFK